VHLLHEFVVGKLGENDLVVGHVTSTPYCRAPVAGLKTLAHTYPVEAAFP